MNWGKGALLIPVERIAYAVAAAAVVVAALVADLLLYC